MALTQTSSKYHDLALKWAPINYEYIHVNHLGRDLLCAVNFDGDWDTSNNRRVATKINEGKLDVKIMHPVSYWSLAETNSHLFILYSFYHADDENHENDFEGCMLIIEKGTDRNVLVGMVTVAHLFFEKYSYKGRLLDSSGKRLPEVHVEDEEGNELHPLIEQEDGKHGLYSLGGGKLYARFRRWIGHVFGRPPDIVVYYPVFYADQQVPGQDRSRIDEMKGTPHYTTFYFKLVDMLDPKEGIWHRKDNPETFQEYGVFNSSNRLGGAHAPWTWDDKFDRFEAGIIWNDPAKLVANSFIIKEGKPIDAGYIKHMYHEAPAM